MSVLASFKALLKVLGFSSLCFGMTVPTFPEGVIYDSLTWLPLWPDIVNPYLLQRIFIAFSPETGFMYHLFMPELSQRKL
jgi:hypothetical protein